jgi:hypothetical protein
MLQPGGDLDLAEKAIGAERPDKSGRSTLTAIRR